MATSLYIDLDASRVVKSLTSMIPINPSGFFRGDELDLNLYFLRQTGVSGAPYTPDDLTGTSIKLAIGRKLGLPTAGTWTVDGGVDLTYAATAAQVQAALRTTQADALLTVTGSMALGFTVDWGSVGVEATLTGTAVGLTPECDLTIGERRAGSVSVIEQQFIRVRLKPAALQDTWADISTTVAATVTTSAGGSATVNEVQKVALDKVPSSGSWTITMPADTRTITAAVVAGVFTTTANHGFALDQPVIFSSITNEANFVEGTTYFVKATATKTTFTISATSGGAAMTTATADAGSGTVTTAAETTAVIAATAPLADVQAALVLLTSIGTGNVSVSGVVGEFYLIAFQGNKTFSNFPAVTSDASGLIATSGKNAKLTLSTYQLTDLLAADASLVLSLEIQTINGSFTTTVISQDVTIYADLIDGATLSPIPLATLLSLFAALDLSSLPTANPGSGKPWLNGGVLQVGV